MLLKLFVVISTLLSMTSLSFSQETLELWVSDSAGSCEQVRGEISRSATAKCRYNRYSGNYNILEASACEYEFYGDDDCDESDGGGYTCPELDVVVSISMKVECI